MRYIAEKYLKEVSKPAEPLPTARDIAAAFKKYRLAVLFGALSITLYSLLYIFNVDLIEMAQQTHHGKKALFFVPIVIALIFSLVHGSFTAYFWDVLGIKPKNKK